MPSQVEWIESLSPWPEEFGLGRMRTLLAELGEPQRAYPSIHVVGTNGKSTATRRAAAFLLREGLSVGAYTSPHVSGWSERIQVDGRDADFEVAIDRVRDAAERLGATQFEVLTAAALKGFAGSGVDAAVIEAGLGGRLDATNVLDAPIVVLTNVSLGDHVGILGDTREAIAREKLAVVSPGATAILGEPDWEALARENGAVKVLHTEDVGRAAAEEFLGRKLVGDIDVRPPGRLELVGDDVYAGAHNPAGVAWLAERLPRRDYLICAAVLADKDARGIVAGLAEVGCGFVATQTESERSLAADELAKVAREFFPAVESVADAPAALERARELAGPDGAVLVTGSLYLLRDLYGRLEVVR